MSTGPRHQLALLWPCLLVAALQVRFGDSGPVLAAAMAAERSSMSQNAVIRVVPFQLEPLTLEGVFAGVAEVMPAEGKLLQFHPLSLCNSSEDELTVPGFVSIVKLERPDRDIHPCLSLANKAKLAGERGARAVLFDITDDQTATEQLRKPRGLNHPVVLIWGHDAERLMGVVNHNREAHVKIEVKEMPAGPDYDVWILLTLLSTVLIIVSIFIVRTRCQPRRSQTNVQEETLEAIGRLATRRYQACRRPVPPAADSVSSCSSAPVCAICLEEFSEGQELRVITCLHEFHRQCVDPWLLEHQSCPLCMFNILEYFPSTLPAQPLDLPRPLGPGQRPRFFRQRPGHAVYRFPPRLPMHCSSALTQGHLFFRSPELSHLDLGTVHYLPYQPMSLDPWCSRPPPLARSLPGPCLVPHEPPCRALRAPPSRGVPLHRGIRRGKHSHQRSSRETYLTEPSGYLPDGPGSDSSSGPCHCSSSDSVLNCTDVSLQAIHGSCSTFHSSLSSDYDPSAFSETPTAGSGPDLPAPRGDPRPQSLGSRAPGRAPLSSHHVHFHHHHHRHHHYGHGPPDCLDRQTEPEASLRKAQPPGGKGRLPASKRGEKSPPEGSLSVSPNVASLGQPDVLLQGQGEFSGSEDPDAKRTDGGLWTSQKPCLQIHANRRKCKAPLAASQAFPPEDSPLAPNPRGVPGPTGSDPGTSCSPESQPLLAWDASKPSATPLPHMTSTCARHSTTKPPEKATRSRPDSQPASPRERPGMDAAGRNGSLNFNRHLRLQLQGSDDDDVPEIYEHSV